MRSFVALCVLWETETVLIDVLNAVGKERPSQVRFLHHRSLPSGLLLYNCSSFLLRRCSFHWLWCSPEFIYAVGDECCRWLSKLFDDSSAVKVLFCLNEITLTTQFLLAKISHVGCCIRKSSLGKYTSTIYIHTFKKSPWLARLSSWFLCLGKRTSLSTVTASDSLTLLSFWANLTNFIF